MWYVDVARLTVTSYGPVQPRPRGVRGRQKRVSKAKDLGALTDALFAANAGKEGEADALRELREAGCATAEAVEAESTFNRGMCFHRALATYFCWRRVRHGPNGSEEMPVGLDPDSVAEYVGHLRSQAGISYSTSTVVSSSFPPYLILSM